MIDFGILPQEFHATLLEKNCHLRKRAVRVPPFEWRDLDTLLNQIEPKDPLFKLYADGPVPPAAYTEEVMELGMRRRKLVLDRFSHFMAGGATLVLNRLEGCSTSAQTLCHDVERYTGFPTTGNGYITFGGKGTFGQHWDVHDVFAVQLIGRKRWRVYEPTFAYPLSTHGSDQAQSRCPPTPVLDCVLEPGDLLYIPRGWWHQATPLDEPSFHLSVATFVPTILDYVLWSCSHYLPQSAEVRRGLTGTADTLVQIEAALQAVKAAISNPTHVAEFMHTVAGGRRPATDTDTALLSRLASQFLPHAPRYA
jgi:hypothetical protein